MSKLTQALFRRKISFHDLEFSKLNKCLSSWDLTLMGIGAIIGTGIFVLTGVAAATQAGPAVVLAFVVAGIACAFAALSYAELASSVGGSGSAYGYSYAAFGELIAWMIGWDLVLEYGVSVAAVANGWSGYFNNALQAIGIGLPEVLTKGPHITASLFSCDMNAGAEAINGVFMKISSCLNTINFTPSFSIDFTHGYINIAAFTIILMLMFMLIIGIKQSARLNAGMVFVKVLTICIFIAVAAFNVKPELWSPFIPFGWFDHTEAGKTIGVLAAASLVFFAYVGFDAVSTAVDEAKDPQRSVPIGILSSLVFCTVIYIIVSGLLTGIVPYTELNVSSPVAFALQKIGYNWASALVATGVIAGLTTVMLVLYYALTRVIFAISRDGLLPQSLGTVNEKTQTPVRTTVICGIIMAVMAGFVPLGALAELVNIGTLAAFVLVCAGVIVMRLRHPEMPRPFKMPFGILLPVLGVLSCLALICFLPLITHMRFGLWMLAGLVIYFGYSIRKSKLATAA